MHNRTANSLQISEIVISRTKPSSEADLGLTGGSITTLTKQFESLLEKHAFEENGLENRKSFTNNLVSSISIIMNLECGWNEIHAEKLRYQTSSDLLVFIDSVGFILGKYLQTSKSNCEENLLDFAADHVSLLVKNSLLTSSNSCFSFEASGSRGSICIPESSSNTMDCSVQVATSYSTDSSKSNIFPNFLSREPQELSFGDQLIGLTLNNRSFSSASPVVITFIHDQKIVRIIVKGLLLNSSISFRQRMLTIVVFFGKSSN